MSDPGPDPEAERDAATWEEVAPRLGAFLSGTLYVGGGPAPVVRVGLLPRLYLHALVEGDPPRLVLATDAGRWRRSHAEIVARALARAVDREISLEPIEGTAVFRVSPHVGSAAWLVLPGFLRSLRDELGGPVVCAVPNGSTCLVGPGGDEASVLELGRIAVEVFEQSERPLSPVVYADDDETGLVRPLPVDPSRGALFDAVSFAERRLEQHAYAEQKAALVEAFAERGLPVLVGDLGLAELDGGWTTTTALVAVEEALLPVSEHVFLGFEGPRGPRRMLCAREDFERIAPGCLLVSPDYDPPRMSPVRPPSDAELEALWAIATLKEEGIIVEGGAPTEGDAG